MYKHLTSEQRYTIYVLLQKGETKSAIAKAIGVHPSTITRELRRNTGRNGKYSWKSAQSNAAYHKHRQPGNRTVSKELIKEVVYLLTHYQWSPKQISGYLKLQGKHISHETIYKIIRKDKKQGGKLYRFCRHNLKHRSKPIGGKRVVITNRTSISDRPCLGLVSFLNDKIALVKFEINYYPCNSETPREIKNCNLGSITS